MTTIHHKSRATKKVNPTSDTDLRYRRLFEASPDGIILLDAERGTIVDINLSLTHMLGYLRKEFVRKKLWKADAFKDIRAIKNAFILLQGGEAIHYPNLSLTKKDGTQIEVEFMGCIYQAGTEKLIQCNLRDITDRKRTEDALLKNVEELFEQSVRDHLTGLFNRRYMEVTLERELLRAARKRLSLGIIMVDVDNFKHFNDTHGHAAGDTILRKLGHLLNKHIRGEDIACRYGGDEFIIILPDASREVAWRRAELIFEYSRSFGEEFDHGSEKGPTLSFGVSSFSENGTTSRAILKAADEALYRAKEEGRGRVVVAADNSPVD